jgi:predicted adenine nucleotide alpha hydrolase (AANH) superfamily ATPase
MSEEDRRLRAEKEAEYFINSALVFIEEQAKRFHTTEEFIEDCLIELIYQRMAERLSGSAAQWVNEEE